MRKLLSALLLCAISIGVSAQTASLLVYKVWEQGIDPYVSRILVTPEHIRLDEGTTSGSFTLFDRSQEIIYNVLAEDRSVLVLDTIGVDDERPESSLILEQEVIPDLGAPLIAGRQPKRIRLLANGEVCSELVVIEGVMEPALEALGEMKRALGRVQAAALDAIPLAMRTPCGLAANVYAADRSVSFGLPIRETSGDRRQLLLDFSADFGAEDSLFVIPDAYSRRPLFANDAI